MFDQVLAIPYQKISFANDISITIKRLDLVHPNISGNKFFKLKYNLLAARQLGYNRLLSFGGAYSNHIFALAHAAYEYGFHSIGVIRGQELQHQSLNATLATAKKLGMQLEFISRQDYRLKHTAEFLQQLQQRYPDAYIIPEGGSNALAVQGCEEILTEYDRENFDVICCAVGTGGTISGLINRSSTQQHVIGFSALKGDFLKAEIQQWTTKNNWSVYSEETFSGYGKFNTTLTDFIAEIQQQYDVPLEPIYTGKAFYQLYKMMQDNHFPASTRILFIHTGGLQAFAASH
ncbi:pyridoxal-phosphate dependent enzyme [Acinetobacter puyangensis]|uniref:1-aminocyclopropane-1-carboxylate deaminase/D-cysteine desulfhydrase n=1 Tax=Acinetobacter puyangensis TaxID=1096779 RepID=A0A240E8H3_9GAMM|nr:pyridoxal-phosphate dependent enzyme [Acinetobacter puyangensis]SNX44866.1 1-aminocyclopropane-1-carboxylate deaminase/D-cysteine desulfhydrase [Acinetobacter puyangensis]